MTTNTNGSAHAYVEAALASEAQRIAITPKGAGLRNQELNRGAFALGGLIGAGVLNESKAVEALMNAAVANGYVRDHGPRETQAVIRNGLRAGAESPRPVSRSNLMHTTAFSAPIRSGKRQPNQTARVTEAVLKSTSLRAETNRTSKGVEGPPARSDELRRHVYRNNGKPVRIKIKFRDGKFVQYFAVTTSSGEVMWQPKKPADYSPVPYIGSLDPFDHKLIGDVVYWPEGERDVDSLGKLGVAAFCFGGCGDGLPDGIDHFLAGRDIVILADNDDAGRLHAEKKADCAHAAGANSVRLVHFPELKPKADVTDWIDLGATADDLEKRADALPTWAPSNSPPAASSASSSAPGRKSWRHGAISASDLKAKEFAPVKYVVPGYIPEGITILAGKPKVGKSWLVLDLCIATAAGRFTLGSLKPPQGDVLYLALEDSQRRLKRRLRKLLASAESEWPERLLMQTDWRRANEGGIADIAEWCDSVTNPTLVVIDTLEKIRPVQNGKVQAYSLDYEAIAGLQKIANERGLAIVINHHVRKMEADDPFDTVSGTLGLTGAADTILVIKRQSGGVTLYARGRDIEESETALQFDRGTCRWTILGAAAEVNVSNERAAVLEALEGAGSDGMTVAELMVATQGGSRGAMDVLLYKMRISREIIRPKRGVYVHPQYAGKIGKKERNDTQDTDLATKSANLTDLTNLTGGLGSALGGAQ